jgi:hypothetical protein
MKRKRAKPATRPTRPARQAQLPMVLGVAWYRADQWQRFRALASDRASLHDTYAEWETSAIEKLRELRSLGIVARAVPIDIDELAHWCREHKLAIDSAARAQFVAEKVQEATTDHR